MKRIIAVVVVVLFIAGLASAIIARAEEADTKTAASMMKFKEGMDKGKMMHRKKGEGGDPMQMMMKSMMQKQIVATSDGGVIVLVGNKLLKYDSDLNLKKEVEIQIDFEGMCKMMKEKMDKAHKKLKPPAPDIEEVQ